MEMDEEGGRNEWKGWILGGEPITSGMEGGELRWKLSGRRNTKMTTTTTTTGFSSHCTATQGVAEWSSKLVETGKKVEEGSDVAVMVEWEGEGLGGEVDSEWNRSDIDRKGRKCY